MNAAPKKVIPLDPRSRAVPAGDPSSETVLCEICNFPTLRLGLHAHYSACHTQIYEAQRNWSIYYAVEVEQSMTTQEAAEVFNISKGNIARILARARAYPRIYDLDPALLH